MTSVGLAGHPAAARINREVAAAYNAEPERTVTIFRDMEAPSWLADMYQLQLGLDNPREHSRREHLCNHIYLKECSEVAARTSLWPTTNSMPDQCARKVTYLLTLTLINRPEPAGSNPVPSAPNITRCLGGDLGPCLTRNTEEATQGPTRAFSRGSKGIRTRAISWNRAALYKVGPGRYRAFLKENCNTSVAVYIDISCVHSPVTVTSRQRCRCARRWS